MEAVLAQMYADDNLEGPKSACKWGEWSDNTVVDKMTVIVEQSANDIAKYDGNMTGRTIDVVPLTYSVPTYTQHVNGQLYLGYPLPMMQPPCLKNAVYVPGFSMTTSEVSSEMSDESGDAATIDTTIVTENGCDTMSEACTELTYDDPKELSDEINEYLGKFTHHAGWRDESKNYGFIKVKTPIKGMTRFIAFDPPQECKRDDTVWFRIVPNKRGKDAWKAVVCGIKN